MRDQVEASPILLMPMTKGITWCKNQQLKKIIIFSPVISGKYPKGYPSGITRKNNVRHFRKQMPASVAGV
jgi:hypothetical protein